MEHRKAISDAQKLSWMNSDRKTAGAEHMRKINERRKALGIRWNVKSIANLDKVLDGYNRARSKKAFAESIGVDYRTLQARFRDAGLPYKRRGVKLSGMETTYETLPDEQLVGRANNEDVLENAVRSTMATIKETTEARDAAVNRLVSLGDQISTMLKQIGYKRPRRPRTMRGPSRPAAAIDTGTASASSPSPVKRRGRRKAA